VSWPLASFGLVGLVLGAGWLAYERKRPSARMVAVVATLSAVAALGRDAFAALPDVKPITAIAFVVGYALGPLPGFTVGAIGMLASNVVLGQGPYTPWQMTAWGLVGLAGAGFGRLGGRRLGRVPLAIVCAACALMAKEIMNVYEWTLGASHTPAAFLAIAGGTSLPYDIADTLATLGFALAFGPELARLLARIRERMSVQWEPHPPTLAPDAPLKTLVAVLLAVTVAAGAQSAAHADAADAGTAHARTARAASLAHELSYLTAAQNADGGFGAAPGARSSEPYTAWAAIGLAAAGRNPAAVRRDGHSVLNALRAGASTVSDLGDVERTILALHACGASPHSFAGRDLVAQTLRARARDGSFHEQVNLTAFAILALRAAGHSARFEPIRAAARWIERQQNADGGFSFGGHGGASDVDDTGAAVQALAAAGARNRRIVNRAARYLLRSQNLDGGFPQRRGGGSNAQSTAWAAQGLIAAKRRLNAVRRRHSRSPLGYLDSLIAPNGSIRYSRTSAQTPVWVTSQALVALAGKVFPIRP
jgi:energy-coupling factor transport system substrate-specific component